VQRLEATGDVRTREGVLEAGEWTKAVTRGRCLIGDRRVLGDVLGGDVRRPVDQTDGGAGHAMAWTMMPRELIAMLSVKSRAMRTKTDWPRRPRGREQSATTHVGAPRVRRLRPCRAVDEDGRCRSMPLSE
jgi:hypothetical protein